MTLDGEENHIGKEKGMSKNTVRQKCLTELCMATGNEQME